MHVGLDHGGVDVYMAKKLLNRPDVVSRFKEVRGENGAGCPAGATTVCYVAHGRIGSTLQYFVSEAIGRGGGRPSGGRGSAASAP